MNYYNPYYSLLPYTTVANTPVRQGILGNLLGRGSSLNWSSILNNTQRVLGIANQAIPVVKQITPVMRNAKTMFQVMNEFKKVDTPVVEKKEKLQTEPSNEVSVKQKIEPQIISNNGPTFFI